MTTETQSPADALGAVEYNGIKVAPIGDDGDVLVAFGHHDLAAVAAAMTEVARVHLGWDEPVEPDEIETHWGHLMTGCEKCGDDPDCAKCANIRSYDGWLSYRDEKERPGRFPIMVADFS